MPDPKKNTAYTFDVQLVDAADPRFFKANPTLAAGDITVSTDESAFSNVSSLGTVSPASGINVKQALTSGEMNGDRIVARFKDQTSPPEWLEVTVTIGTTTVTVDDLVRSTTPANALTVDASGLVDITQTAADKVWASASRSLTSFGTLVADVTTAVWAAGTRTLTSFGTLVADVAAAVGALVIEGTVTLIESLRLSNAAQGGKTSGMDTGTPVIIRDVGDTKDRVTATTDANGNRTAVTLDLT